MARITFSQAKALLASTVSPNGGDDPTVAVALNFVVERFLKDPRHFKGSQLVLKLVANPLGILALPTSIEAITKLQASTDTDTPAEFVNLQSEYYLFNEDGPGYLPQSSTTSLGNPNTATKIPGYFATHYDPPVAQALKFTYINGGSSVPPSVTIKANDDENNPIYTTGTEGITFTIDPTSKTYTTTVPISSIYQITKPICQGEIKIECVDIGGVIGLLYPKETNPEYARYKVLGPMPDTRGFYALCTRAFIPFSSESDLVIPSNLNALRYGMMAYRYESVNDIERAQGYWKQAYDCLEQELANLESGVQLQVDVQLKGFMAPIRNLI